MRGWLNDLLLAQQPARLLQSGPAYTLQAHRPAALSPHPLKHAVNAAAGTAPALRPTLAAVHSASAFARRFRILSSVSVPRPRRRRSSSSGEGGEMNTSSARSPSMLERTCKPMGGGEGMDLSTARPGRAWTFEDQHSTPPHHTQLSPREPPPHPPGARPAHQCPAPPSCHCLPHPPPP